MPRGQANGPRQATVVNHKAQHSTFPAERLLRGARLALHLCAVMAAEVIHQGGPQANIPRWKTPCWIEAVILALLCFARFSVLLHSAVLCFCCYKSCREHEAD